MLQSVGIPPTRLTAYPHELSGGMCQRVMIALALALRPKLVIADEPTTALDVVVEAQIVELLTELTRSLGTSLLLITHDLGIAATVCERTIVLYAGRIAEDGPTPSVFTEPAHPYTADLLSATITLDTVELRSIPGSPPSLGSPPPGCRYHPRCAHAMEVCTTTQPHETRDGSRSAWCWLRDVAAVDEAVPSTRVAR
jgi:peptide/nickel transport system ATP-binding protein